MATTKHNPDGSVEIECEGDVDMSDVQELIDKHRTAGPDGKQARITVQVTGNLHAHNSRW